MATQKKTTAKKPSTGQSTAKKKTTKAEEPEKLVLNLEEAAEVLGISAHDLEISRYRGIEPGKLGFKQDGVLMWKRSDLKKAEAKTE
jgi:hypothetical protein